MKSLQVGMLQDAYEANKERFLEAVEYFRGVRGLSISEFHQLLSLHGVPLVTARRWRRLGPPFDRTELYSQILGVPLAYLILRHDLAADVTLEQAELNRLWKFLNHDAQQSVLAIVRQIATLSPDYVFS